MTVVIDGTNGVSGVDGTASNPSYEGTDANTGIFFPAADTIAFSEGGTEVARFDSSGNLGIGTSSPAKQLDLAANNTGITTGDPLNTLRFTDTDTTSAAGQPIGRVEWYSADTDTAGVKAYIQAQSTDGSPDADMIFATNHVSGGGTAERMRIQYDGNVGIGTSSPAYALEVKRTGVISQIAATSDTTAAYSYARYNSGGTNVVTGVISDPTTGYISVETNHPLVMRTNGTERMRIDTSGNLLVGSTSSPATARTYLKGVSATSSDFALLVQNSAGTDMNYVRNDGLFSTGVASQSPYNKTTASAANVFVDSGGVLNRSTSSIKYKQNVKDAVHGLSDLLNLRAVTYEGKSEEDAGKTFGGLLAEEVHNAGLTEFVQYADDGSPDALAYGNMVSLCIKAIQELKAELDATKAEVALLKGAA